MISKTTASFSEREVKNKISLIMLVQAVAIDDKPAFYYVAVHGSMLEDFKKAMDSCQPFDLEKYTQILLSGYGEPEERVIQYMEETYGFNQAEAPKMLMTAEGLKQVL